MFLQLLLFYDASKPQPSQACANTSPQGQLHESFLEPHIRHFLLPRLMRKQKTEAQVQKTQLTLSLRARRQPCFPFKSAFHPCCNCYSLLPKKYVELRSFYLLSGCSRQGVLCSQRSDTTAENSVKPPEELLLVKAHDGCMICGSRRFVSRFAELSVSRQLETPCIYGASTFSFEVMELLILGGNLLNAV